MENRSEATSNKQLHRQKQCCHIPPAPAAGLTEGTGVGGNVAALGLVDTAAEAVQKRHASRGITCIALRTPYLMLQVVNAMPPSNGLSVI